MPVPARQTLMGYTTAISKMPQTTVDHIPLVYGIIPPTSPDEVASTPSGGSNEQRPKSPAELEEGRTYSSNTTHLPEHPLPPLSTSNANTIIRGPRFPLLLRLFRLVARRPRKKEERNIIPTIYLRESQRTCAICFEDFVSSDTPPSSSIEGGTTTSTSAAVNQLPELPNQSGGNGIGIPEPLRLLECQHVFHVSLPYPFHVRMIGRSAEMILRIFSTITRHIEHVTHAKLFSPFCLAIL
jgi:hypothetical protein